MRRKEGGEWLVRFISAFSFVAAAAIALVLPGLYFLTKYEHEKGSVESLSRIHGSLVTVAINKNPVMWRFEEHKLIALVTDRTQGERLPTVFSILDEAGAVIVASSDEALAKPVIRHEATLYDSGSPVGFYRVERSIRAVLWDTFYVALGGFLIALVIAIPLRHFPLRALRQSQQRLVHMAHHDVLTGLPNRALLDDRLAQAINYAQRYKRLVTIVFIDLDNFKTINDSLGHDVGDELLRQVARRMQQTVRRTDTVVRLGGDEFVIVLFDQPEPAESITRTLQKIRSAVADPLHIGHHTLRVTCSMGLASFPNDGPDVNTLLKNADAAMYRAKELGRDNFQFFTAEMNGRLQERMFMQQGLLEALANDEFALVYQPQIALESGQIVGVETLIRWRHPELGMIPPAKFIPIAEESGMIVQIGEWVLRTACRQNKAWQEAGLPAIRMSVNVSPRQFKEANWVAIVQSALQECALDPALLELEITESLIMENVERAVSTMKELQDMGVHLAIDDFGTGYSSLSSLKHFPVARLKIDQSFIRSLPGTDDDQSIAMAVIALGHRLKLKVIAEGVETALQQAFLRDNACDEMQGYHFSKPVDADEIGRMLARSLASRPEPVCG